MKFTTTLLAMAAALVLTATAPASAREHRPGLDKQVLDASRVASRNMALLRHKALTQRQLTEVRGATIRVRLPRK